MYQTIERKCLVISAELEFFKDHMKRLDRMIPLEIQDAIKQVDMYLSEVLEDNKNGIDTQ